MHCFTVCGLRFRYSLRVIPNTYLRLFVLVAVSPTCADVGFFLGRTGTMRPGGVSFLAGFRFYLVGGRRGIRARFLEHDSARHGLRDFFLIRFSHGDEDAVRMPRMPAAGL